MIKRNSTRGYSLIGIMIALTVATVLLMTLTKSYMSSRQATAYADAVNIMTSQLDLTLNQISGDIAKSGSFGCYNLRMQGVVAANSAFTHGLSGSGAINPANGGLMVFASSASAVAENGTPLAGINLDSGSQILKVQYGDGFAAVESPTTDPVTVLTYHQPDYQMISGGNLVSLGGGTVAGKLDVTGLNTSSLLILASCSRWDLIQGTLAGNDFNISAAYGISLSIPPVHDVASLAIMNARTRYYYIATVNGVSGLYVNQLLNGGSYSGSLLLLPNVSGLSFTFQVTGADGSHRNNVALASMGSGDWLNLVGVNIFFNYRSGESVTDSNQPLVINESATVAILSSGATR